jgi:hypothetical protein
MLVDDALLTYTNYEENNSGFSMKSVFMETI